MADTGVSNREFDPFFRGLRVVFIDPQQPSSGGSGGDRADQRSLGALERRPEWVARTTGLIEAVTAALPDGEEETSG